MCTQLLRRRASIMIAMTFSVLIAAVAPVAVADDSPLIKRQASVADRYEKLEKLLLRLADLESAENPERSALLRRAARQSRDKFVLEKLRGASEALRDQKYQAAVDNQGVAKDELQSILKLLMSEDRSKRIRDEKERYANMIKNLKRIERAQRSTRARTENGADLDELEPEQKSIGDRSEKLKDEIEEESEPPLDVAAKDGEPKDGEPKDGEPKDGEPKDGEPKDGEPKDGEPKDGEPKDGEPKDGEPKDGEPKDGEPKDGEPKDGEPKDGEPKDGEPKDGEPKDGEPKDGEPKDGEPKDGEPKDGEPKDGEPKDGEPKDGSQSQDSLGQQSDQQQSGQQSDQQAQPQSPEQQAQQELQRAIERMREAEKELKNAQRQAATEKQREAEENLRKAIDRLERILRQLREEEMQRELAKLEARLRKMAAMQSQVLDDTVTLAATPKQQRNRQTDLKAGDLAFEEKKITLEADRAMLLLREEGSSVAFPEVVDQIRKDTVRVSEFLGESKIDTVTQGIQKDILAALEEMIAALQQAQRELEEQQQQRQQNPQQPQKPGEQPLVEALAELKLIRTMETRVKSTTDRYAGLLESGESAPDEILPLLQDLSERQNRLYRITRDLVLKRNQ